MRSFRLTNLLYADISQALPLPSLPYHDSVSAEGLIVGPNANENNEQASPLASGILHESAHPEKLAALLRQTDVSYLSFRDGHNIETNKNRMGGLRDAVEQMLSDEHFNVRNNLDSRLQSVTAESAYRASPLSSISEFHLQKGAIETPPQPTLCPASENKSEYRPEKPRVKRKRTPVSAEQRKRSGILASRDNANRRIEGAEAEVQDFCSMLDEFFLRKEDEDFSRAGALSSMELNQLALDISHFRNNKLLAAIPHNYLTGLLAILGDHINADQGQHLQEGNEAESSIFAEVLSAIEAAQVAMTIMTSPGMPSIIFIEEVIERIVKTMRYHVETNVLPNFRQKSLQKVSKAMTELLQKICSMTANLVELLAATKLQDNVVIQLCKTCLAVFEVDNLQILQQKCIDLLCQVFVIYEHLRSSVIEDFVSLLWKLPASKRHLRTFHLLDSDRQIQTVTALLISLIQSSATPLEPIMDGASGQDGSPRVFESATEVATLFWKRVMQVWSSAKSHEGIEAKGVIENVTMDLLEALNLPDYPAASTLLQVLCAFLAGSSGIKSKDVGTRGMAIELLGFIITRLKVDALAAKADKYWVLKELTETASGETDKNMCYCCGKNCSKADLCCRRCNRCLHIGCIGHFDEEKMVGDWLCPFCTCRRQLASVKVESKNLLQKLIPRDDGRARIKAIEIAESSINRFCIVQQMLLNYLISSSDTSSCAQRFYLGQWYRDEVQSNNNQDTEGLAQFYLARAGAESQSTLLQVNATDYMLSKENAFSVSRALGQQRPLARGLEKLMDVMLKCLQEQSPVLRAKALKAVSSVVEVDPTVLQEEHVHQAVEGRLLDSAISVREAATDLVGKYIVSFPEVALKYYDRIGERIMDTGVSVRKKVIKIIREICLSQPTFLRIVDGCVKMMSRINDDESSIRDLVTRTFHELWFADKISQSQGDPLMDEATQVAHHAQQLVDVLRSLPNNQPLVAIIKRSLRQDEGVATSKGPASTLGAQGAARRRCELMCKSLLESMLQADEAENSDSRALPYVSALHAFCTVDATLCAPSSDPSRFAVTLHPYLKAQGDSRDSAQLVQYVAYIIDAVLPLLRRPSAPFLEELEKDLCNLIRKHPFLTVVQASIKCLSALRTVSSRCEGTYLQHIVAFHKALVDQPEVLAMPQKSHVLRCLFALSLFLRYGADSIDKVSSGNLTVIGIIDTYKMYLRSADFIVKARALQGLGFIFIAQPNQMLTDDIKIMLKATLSARADKKLKIQTLKNFSDYLHAVEEKLGEGGNNDPSTTRDEGAVPIAAGAGDSNNWTGIAQLYWEPILERSLDSDSDIRFTALKVIDVILRQGLVHPATCVPNLIALEVDQCEANANYAHRLLTHMYEKHPGIFENRLGDGLYLSFQFSKSGASILSKGVGNGWDLVEADWQNVVAAGSTTSAAAWESSKVGIARIYKLIRGNRQSRNKFLSSVIRKFDFGVMTESTVEVPFLEFCAQILAALPFGIPDEPLYVVYNINRIVTLRGGGLISSMKAALAENGALGHHAQVARTQIAAEVEEQGQEAYDISVLAGQEEPLQKVSHDFEDIKGASAAALSEMKDNCREATSLALLLVLKQYLKYTFSLTDGRCQAFQPSEAQKPGESLIKRDNSAFSTSTLQLVAPETMRQMVEQYEVFKSLLKNDSTQDFTGLTPTTKRKSSATTAALDQSPGTASGLTSTPRKGRRKSMPLIMPAANCSNESDEDDWDAEGSEYHFKRRKVPSTGKKNSRKGKDSV